MSGINALNIQQSALTGFDLQTGFNSIGIEYLNETYFELIKGFNGFGVENEHISNWTLINEFSEQVFLDGTFTVINGLESYSLPVTGGTFTVFPYIDDLTLLPVFQRVQFSSSVSDESGYVDLIPTAGEYVLRIYKDKERENFSVASFGGWNRAIQPSEILHLHNNSSYNNPWVHLPIYHDRFMQKGMENWLQFQDGSFYDDLGTLKVTNYGNGTDAVANGFIDLNDIEDSTITIK